MTERVTIEREGDDLVIRIPMQLKRRGGRKEIIVPEGLPQSGAPRPREQEPLVVALARAFYWTELVHSGRFGSIGELADALGIDRAYASRIMRLTLLAPALPHMTLRKCSPSPLMPSPPR